MVVEGSTQVILVPGNFCAIIAAAIPGPLPISRIEDGFREATSSRIF
jgi:hypothetical protein